MDSATVGPRREIASHLAQLHSPVAGGHPPPISSRAGGSHAIRAGTPAPLSGVEEIMGVRREGPRT